jgi:hypothetical protein
MLRHAFLSGAAFVLLACSTSVVFTEGNGSGGAGGSSSSSTASSTAATGGNCDCGIGAYLPVCGVDGVTYDAACGRECVPVEIACEGECPCNQCALIETEYLQVLAAAKACSPMLTVEQCTMLVEEKLTCPCGGTYVNPNNREVSKLFELREQFFGLGCNELVGCPDILCTSPEGAGCDGASASCIDLIAQ